MTVLGAGCLGGLVWVQTLSGTDADIAREGYSILFGAGTAVGLGVGIPLWVVGQGHINDGAKPQLSLGLMPSRSMGASLRWTF